jgi:hypothetical protein
MKLLKAAVVLAGMVFTATLSAEDRKSGDRHDCPVGHLFCPAEGGCEGACRSICDRSGEALAAVRTNLAASIALLPKEDQARLPKGNDLDKEIIGPALKERVWARFASMNSTETHAVEVNGKSETVTCTFLTGKLCAPCVEEITRNSQKALEAWIQKAAK